MKKLFTALLALVLGATCLFTATACDGCNDDEDKIKIVNVDLSSEEYAFAVKKGDVQLKNSVNQFFVDNKAEIDDIFEKYTTATQDQLASFGSSNIQTSPTGSDDELVVATNLEFAPFEYTEGGAEFYGVDMEIAKLLADYLGKELVIEHMDFDAVCLAVGNKQCDIAMAGLTVREDLMEYVNFTDSYYSASQKLIVTSTNTEFDACADAAAVEAILLSKDKTAKIKKENIWNSLLIVKDCS